MAGKVMSGRYGTSRGANYGAGVKTGSCMGVKVFNIANAWLASAGRVWVKPQPGQRNATCIVRYTIEKRKIGFALRSLVNPSYGYRAWLRFCATPIA